MFIIPDEVSKHANVFDVLKERGFIEQTTDEDEIISVVTDVTHFVKYCKANASKLGTVSAAEAKEK